MVIWVAFHWHKVTSQDPCIQQWLEITFQKEWCHNGIFADDSNTFWWHFVPPLIFSSHYISWWSLARLYCFSCLLLDFFIYHLDGLFSTYQFPFYLDSYIDWAFWPLICFIVVLFVLFLAFLLLLGHVAFTSLSPSFDLLTFSFVNFGCVFWLFPCGFPPKYVFVFQCHLFFSSCAYMEVSMLWHKYVIHVMKLWYKLFLKVACILEFDKKTQCE
jgi:hypothetical protein